MSFTILHWLSILFFLILFGLILFLIVTLSQKEATTYKIMAAGGAFLLLAMLNVAVIYWLEGVTKQGELSNIKETRVYQNESMLITGRVTNKGKFDIGYCELEITFKQTVVNTDLSALKAQLDEYLAKKGFLERIAAILKPAPVLNKPYSVVFTEPISGPLEPGEYEDFILNLRIPSAFDDPKITYKLTCH
ncbi:MAG: DUF2393 domain-containing protein [Campylobacterales bacterium]